MSDPPPDLRMMNLIVRDMPAAIEFYRRLGVVVPDSTNAAGIHVELPMPSGFSLELDTAESATWWHAGWRSEPGTVAAVVCFALPSRDAVDAKYADLTDAGYAGRQPPFDAFWGARFAILADPDGNDIGLMSPMEDDRRAWPPTESPDP